MDELGIILSAEFNDSGLLLTVGLLGNREVMIQLGPQAGHLVAYEGGVLRDLEVLVGQACVVKVTDGTFVTWVKLGR